LKVEEVQRFYSIKKAVSYCGLCGVEKSSGNTVKRTSCCSVRTLTKSYDQCVGAILMGEGDEGQIHYRGSVLRNYDKRLCKSEGNVRSAEWDDDWMPLHWVEWTIVRPG
jgi:hypothetical protein